MVPRVGMRTVLWQFVEPYNLVLMGVLLISGAAAYHYYKEPVVVPKSTVAPPVEATAPTVACAERTFATTTRNVILRVDDIQAFAWGSVARLMVEDAIKNGAPLSLAIIPPDLPKDTALISFLKERECMLEFALHGYDNLEPEPTVGEFGRLSREEAVERLRKGLAVLRPLSPHAVTTFVPPLNQSSVGTIAALDELGFKIISSEGGGRYDFDTTTFDFHTDKLRSVEQVVRDCENAFSKGETECVVMIHPQDFVTEDVLDDVKYRTYLGVIEELKKKDYSFVRFRDTL